LKEEEITKLAELLMQPFYLDIGFWISVVIGVASVFFSVMAFTEARKAKQAASEAGKTVKIQTITIELTEIAQRLDKLDFNLSFSEARDLLNEVSRKIRRLIAPFQSSEDMVEACESIKTALDNAKMALEELRPQSEGDNEMPLNSVYFATQGHFSNISDFVAEIMGLFEKRNIEVNE
jgi:hypothetical protein